MQLIHGSGNLKANIEQRPADDNSDPGGSYNENYGGTSAAVGAGARFSWRVFAIDLYSSYNSANFDRTPKLTGISGGIKFEWMLNARRKTLEKQPSINSPQINVPEKKAQQNNEQPKER